MLEFKNVTRKYLRRTALKDISFALEPGQTRLLLGPNGSGKTTLMKLAAGLARQTAGEVPLEGGRVGPDTKARVAYMPTENYFFSYMTVKGAGQYYADFFRDFSRERHRGLLDRRVAISPGMGPGFGALYGVLSALPLDRKVSL